MSWDPYTTLGVAKTSSAEDIRKAYRKLAKKAWVCVARKMTFRPCEIGFKEEAKNVLIGSLILSLTLMPVLAALLLPAWSVILALNVVVEPLVRALLSVNVLLAPV